MFRSLLIVSLTLSFFSGKLLAQRPAASVVTKHSRPFGTSADPFGIKSVFIENKGQYGDTIPHYGYMGKILYGYEGWGLPVFFTSRGLVYLQKHGKDFPKFIIAEWPGANPHPEIVADRPATTRHSYGKSTALANGFGTITYKDLYPGIDIEYSFIPGRQSGFEYRIIVRPGADPSALKIAYGGDISNIKDSSGNLVVNSGIGNITESAPVSYYADEPSRAIRSRHLVTGRKRSFFLPDGYDRRRRLVIDPFVTTTAAALTGLNVGKVMQVDFDYNGDVYVQGGTNEDGQIAKFDPTGNMVWRFATSVPGVSWFYGDNFGGWTVEKTTGNVYVGQGSYAYGCSIIRLNSATGGYDNFHTPNFHDRSGRQGEIWKMRWYCNGGSPQVMIAGGSGGVGDFADNIGVLLLPTTNFTSYNVTGITTYPYNQDVSDFVIDPANNDLYCILASGNTPFVNNRIYKNIDPYTAANQQWNTLSGYTVLHEDNNTPYVAQPSDPNNPQGSTNATNILAVTSSYLFYYDGKNLKAFDPSTGAGVGTPVTLPSAALMQQGIYADECNNVYIGAADGTIKVYRFNGTTFDDNAVADIAIPGYAGKAVYALSYDQNHNLLYAGGDGFVASFDVSANCGVVPPPPITYNLSVTPVGTSVTSSITPAPPPGSVITYTLLQGTAIVGANATGAFSGLAVPADYTMRADIILGCASALATADFKLKVLQVQLAATDVCGPDAGSITATASGGTSPYLYSSDGINFQQSNKFPNLSPGSYTITVMDDSHDHTSQTVSIAASDLTVDAGTDKTICEGTSTRLAGSTNGTSLAWSPSDGLSSTDVANPDAAPVATTQYYLSATKGNCTLTASVTVQVLPAPVANAGKDTSVCYGTNGVLHGSGVSESGSWSWTPATFLNNDAVASPVVSQATRSVAYVLHVTDASGCGSLHDDTVLLRVVPPTQVSAGRDTTIASNAPLQLHAEDVNHSGFDRYTWSPSEGLNNAFSEDPIAILDKSITYEVRAITPEGCPATDVVKITVYKGPDIYVPGAFTPNGDGHNDVLRITAPGVVTLRSFAIFNRWGQEVFRTANPSMGWDGKLNGTPQEPGTYVWMVEGLDYTGKLIQKKGTLLLIR
jgi:gliding motility-associated-like protein